MDEELHPHFYFGDRVAGGKIHEMDCSVLKGFKGRFRCITYKRKVLWMSRILGLLFRREYTAFILSNDSACLSEWIFLYIAKLLGKRTYLWTHGWYGDENRWARFRNLAFYRPVTGLLLYGERARYLLMKQGVPARKLNVIYNSLDYDIQLDIRQRLKPSGIYAEHFGAASPTLLFIGRFTEVKLLPMIVDCIKEFKKQGTRMNAVFVGDGPKREELEQIIEAKGLNDRVWLPGACYDEQKNAEYLYNADLCVSPGNVGLTALHSLTYGTPVVTHNNFCRQMPEAEAITPDVTGMLFEQGSQESLFCAVQEWLRLHPRKTQATREACYRVVDAHYNPHYQLKVLKEILTLETGGSK